MKWKQLTDYPKYSISEFGDIKNNTTQKILKKTLSKKGYERVDLSYNKNLLIHKLVYKTFVGTIDTSLVIDHIDGNKLNNHYSNLQQITSKENTRKGNRCKKITLKDNLKNATIEFETFRNLLEYVGYSKYYTLETINKSKKFKNNHYEIVNVKLGGDDYHAH